MFKNQQPNQNPKRNREDKYESSISLDDLAKLREEAREQMQGHSWRQSGTVIHCESCPFDHAFYVDPGVLLTGIDEEGNPILDKVQY